MSKLAVLEPNRNQRRQRRASESANLVERPHQRGNTVQRLPNILGQAALLEWLGQTPIAFNRAYVGIAGGVLPALWLSAAMERVAAAKASEFEVNGDYVFVMTRAECEVTTGLCSTQQVTSRRLLVSAGLMSERPNRKYVEHRLHLDRIARALMAQAAPLAESLATYEPLPDLPAAWVGNS